MPRGVFEHRLKPLGERIASKIGSPTPEGCREWQGTLNGAGYGVVAFKHRLWRVHIVVAIVYYGKIPKGKEVCHRCDNPRCINPQHLYIASHKENMHDAVRTGRFDGFKRRRKVTPAIQAAIQGAPPEVFGTDLAKQFGISQGVISEVRNGIWPKSRVK